MGTSDDTPHVLTLCRLTRLARAVIAAEEMDLDLAHASGAMPALCEATAEAARYAAAQGRGRCRDAWPMLAQACTVALRHLSRCTGEQSTRDEVARWQTIVGALLPLAAADWRDWRDATTPKLRSR